MLTKTDEFPFHQTADTFAAVLSGDKHWNDGHYICLCDDEGKVSLIGTVRLYQNNDVLDGFLCLRHEGKQHNIRVSRRLRPDVDHYGAGPLRIEIVEPMKTIRLVLEDNDYGISCDVLCHSVAVPYESPTNVLRVDGRLLGERITYEVAGRAEGHVTVEGNRYELAPRPLRRLPQPLVGIHARPRRPGSPRRAAAFDSPPPGAAQLGPLRDAGPRGLLRVRRGR